MDSLLAFTREKRVKRRSQRTARFLVAGFHARLPDKFLASQPVRRPAAGSLALPPKRDKVSDRLLYKVLCAFMTIIHSVQVSCRADWTEVAQHCSAMHCTNERKETLGARSRSDPRKQNLTEQHQQQDDSNRERRAMRCTEETARQHINVVQQAAGELRGIHVERFVCFAADSCKGPRLFQGTQ